MKNPKAKKEKAPEKPKFKRPKVPAIYGVRYVGNRKRHMINKINTLLSRMSKLGIDTKQAAKYCAVKTGIKKEALYFHSKYIYKIRTKEMSGVMSALKEFYLAEKKALGM